MKETTIKRPARTYSISVWQKNGRDEFRVMHGNRVLSRHSDVKSADAALYALLSPSPSQT